MTGCTDCKFFKSELGSFENGKFESIKKCERGNDLQMIKWWDNNGSKIRGKDIFDNMDCHEYSDSTKSLINLNKLASEILSDLSNR